MTFFSCELYHCSTFAKPTDGDRGRKLTAYFQCPFYAVCYSHFILVASGAFTTNIIHDKFIKVAISIAVWPLNRNINEFHSKVFLISLTTLVGVGFLLLWSSGITLSLLSLSLSSFVMIVPVSSHVAQTENVPGCRRLQTTFPRPLMKMVLDKFIKANIKSDSRPRSNKECTNHSMKQLHSLVICRSRSL